MAPKWPRFRDLWPEADLTVDIEEPKEAIDVPYVPSVDEVRDDLDALLRHRLLREPSGFEGLIPRPEDLTPCD